MVWPTYGSFKPISWITLNTPTPKAPPTSNFPLAFGGSMTSGLYTYPFTSPLESAVMVSPSIGPSPWILMVKRSSSPFIMEPIMPPAVRRRPSAAVATGLVLWAFLASSTRSLVVDANARICPSAAVARII